MKETWKFIEESKYQISNLGRIRNSKSGRILKYYNKNKQSPNIRLVIKGKKKIVKIGY